MRDWLELLGRRLDRNEVMADVRGSWPAASSAAARLLALQIAATAALDAAFDALDAAFDAPGACTAQDLLPWQVTAGQSGPRWPALAAALARLDAGIGCAAHRAAGAAAGRLQAWWRFCAERQVAAGVQAAAWRAEATPGTQPGPSLSKYLAIGARSIGIEWMAASLVVLDGQARVPIAGSVLERTIASIARMARLANDLYVPDPAPSPGKLTWRRLRARELVGEGVATAVAEHRATVELSRLVTSEAERARRLLRLLARQSAVSGGSPRLVDGLSGLLQRGLVGYAPPELPLVQRAG